MNELSLDGDQTSKSNRSKVDALCKKQGKVKVAFEVVLADEGTWSLCTDLKGQIPNRY